MKFLQQSLPRGLRAGADEQTILLESLVWLWGAGSGLLVVSLALTPHAGARHLAIMGAAVAALAGGLFGLRRLRRVSAAAVFAAGLVGHVVVAALIVGSADPGSFYALLYAWIVVHAGFFLSGRRVAIHVVVAGATYAGALALTGPDAAAPVHWTVLVGSLAFAAALTSTLRRRIRGLLSDLRRANRTDPLTGFLTRPAFGERLEEEVERAARLSSPLCVLAVDLDHFKRVNELLGHGSADTVLSRVGLVFAETVGRPDTTARVGGAEFLILVRDTDAHGGLALAERLRAAVHAAYDGQLTVSIGIASVPVHGDTASGVLRAAEQGLRAAKELGRDRSLIYTNEVANILAQAAGRRGSEGDIHLATVLTLAEALDMRDLGTARHSETVGRYAESMARELGLAPAQVERIRLAGVLHDIGKIAVRDSILLKPAKLTDDEYAEMKKHPEIGARIVASAGLEDIRRWVAAHHERPDGRGYPLGLEGEEIPLEARILAVADSYEAMTAERVYKRAMPVPEARAELRRCAGAQFDPEVVDALLRLPDYETGSVEPQWAA